MTLSLTHLIIKEFSRLVGLLPIFFFYNYNNIIISKLAKDIGSLMDAGCGLGRSPRRGIKMSWTYDFGRTVRSIVDREKLDYILDIGGGARGISHPGYINLDIVKHEKVSLVADAHYLPFESCVIDFIICQAVVEHLRKPWVAADEMYRVLKKDGYIYIDSAFMQPYHGYPHHYFNTTKKGLEILFEKFRKIDSGVQPYQMPSYTMTMILGSYIALFIKSENILFSAYREVKKSRMGDLVLKFFKFLDTFINRKKAETVAAGVYFLGVKAE